MIKIKQLFVNPIFWSFIIFIGLEICIYLILKCEKADPEIIAASLTGIIAIYGYFLSHFLETYRKQRENKLQQYRALVKSIRIFLNEQGNSFDDLKKQREEFHNAHFDSTLLISSEGYKKFRAFMNEYNSLQKTPNGNNKELLKLQNDFINELRKEFLPFDKINFESEQMDLKPDK